MNYSWLVGATILVYNMDMLFDVVTILLGNVYETGVDRIELYYQQQYLFRHMGLSKSHSIHLVQYQR